jgi:creatinine amidohydrolase
MAGGNRHVLEEMTWPEMRDALGDIKAVVIPTGSTEQHGPNTSFWTDTGRADGFCKLIAERMHPRVLAATPIGYGISYHHMRFPGSVTLKPETFMAVVYDVVESFTRHGLDTFVIINGHGGNMPALQLVTMKLRYELRVKIAYLTPTAVARDAVDAGKTADVIGHACENETSQLMYLGHEHMISNDTLAPGEIRSPRYPHAGFAGLPARIQVPSYFDEVTANGALGDARGSSWEYGRATVELACDRIVEFLEAFIATDQG